MVKVTTVTPKQVRADVYVVGVDHERRAPGLRVFGLEKNPVVRRVLQDKAVALGPKKIRAIPLDDGWLLLVGLGDPKDLTQEKLGSAVHQAVRAAGGLGAKRAAATFLSDVEGHVQAIVTGAVAGSLAFDQYKSKKQDEGRLDTLQLVLPGQGVRLRNQVKDAVVVAEALNDARLLANAPANIATPKWLAAEARRRGRKHGFKVQVKGRQALRREGYGALCGVAQGSPNEEQLIVMDHHPEGAKKTLVVVGKGVCFDTGGISIKPAMNMWDMKYDKCGACNVIALMTTLKALGVRHRVVGIVAAVENMPSGEAQRPGDIVTAKDGTTVEVLNTDAEGRLILADAITHGLDYKPDWMCDMATLTGACEVAVGGTYVAVMSKDDALRQRFVDASHRAGDKAWPLPQGEEFDEANKGTYGDLQNLSLTSRAGTSVGGAFVAHFAKDTPFVHIDVASKAWTKGQDYFGKGPTGAGMRMVLQVIQDS